MKEINHNKSAPFTYFGRKSLIAPRVWSLFGDVKTYVEPFAGSLAVLLHRPSGFKGSETVNDYSCHVVNAWRTIQSNPKGLAELCVAPASEVNTEAQHYALVRDEMSLRDKLGDPHYYDTEKAAWWMKGQNEYIGCGWSSGHGPWKWSREDGWIKRTGGKGVNRQLPHLGAGKGVNRQLPHLGDEGKGVNRQLLHLGDEGTGERAKRIAWLMDWFSALSDRLCRVRITCGDWKRLANSKSATTKHGVTALFLDPPYGGTEYVYGDKTPVSQSVNEWCAAIDDQKLRVVLCGRGSEHDNLIDAGWQKEEWKTRKGYGSNNEEALWHNCPAQGLFSTMLTKEG